MMRAKRNSSLRFLSAALYAAAMLMPVASVAADSDYVPPHVLSAENPISIGHSISGNLTTSTEPVDILSHGVHFRIPRNYIYNILESKDRAVDFGLETLYPDFAGAKDEVTIKTKMGTQNWQTSHNLINIFSNYSPFSPEHDPNTLVFTAEKNELDHPWKYDLLKSTKSLSAKVQNVYFQRPSATSHGIVIFCPNHKDNVMGCGIYMRITNDVVVHYMFSPELLPHWQEINRKVTNLIQSFIVKKEQ